MNEGAPKSVQNTTPEKNVSPETLTFEQVIKKYGLTAGAKVAFEKIAMEADSENKIGTVINGTLREDVQKGKPIEFSDSGAVISNIADLKEVNNTLYFKTTTSVYKFLEQKKKTNEFVPVDDVESVLTRMGSQYNYLPDGTTQRFKKVEGKYYAPQTALVYVPDWEWIEQNMSPDKLAQLGDNRGTYEENLFEYVQGKNKKCYIIDKDGNKLDTNEKIRAAEGGAFLTFGDENKVDFMLPVSYNPRIGFLTYDSRKYKDEKTGEYLRDGHLGNQVTQINLKKK